MITAAEPPRSPASEPVTAATVRKGFKWSFGVTLIQGVLQVVVTMTMARLLLPTDYGLYAMVEVVLRWAGLMAQMGLGTVLVQKREVTGEDLKAARTLAVGLALIGTVIVASAAPLIASWFGNASVVPYLQVASLSFLINGMGLTSIAMLRRRMEFGRLGAAELSGYIGGNGLTAVFLASQGAGVWAVVIGTLVGQLLQNGVAIIQARLPLGFSRHWGALRPLVRQGTHVSMNTMLDITNNTMDTFVVARVMPPAIVGLFNRSAMLASLPANFLWTAVSRVTFPSYSRLQHAPQAFAQMLRRVQAWSSTVCVAVPLAMIPAADVVVHVLLGSRWSEAVPIVRLLLLGVAFESLAFPYHNALDALGCYASRTRIRLVIVVVRASSLIVFALFRSEWLFYVAAIAASTTWLVSIRPVARRLGERAHVFLRDDLRIVGRAVACALVVTAVRFLGHLTSASWTATLVACMLAGAAMLAFVLRHHLAGWRSRP